MELELAVRLPIDGSEIGVHVAYITIDAAIDTPWTRVPIHPDKPDDGFPALPVRGVVQFQTPNDGMHWLAELVCQPRR